MSHDMPLTQEKKKSLPKVAPMAFGRRIGESGEPGPRSVSSPNHAAKLSMHQALSRSGLGAFVVATTNAASFHEHVAFWQRCRGLASAASYHQQQQQADSVQHLAIGDLLAVMKSLVLEVQLQGHDAAMT